jgi:LacI family transcriptional regulator
VAREAGVSTATVSRVVHSQEGVRPATRQRVLQVIEALGYVPDSAAQSMARKRKEVVGLVAIESRDANTDIEHEGLLFIDEVLRGVECALSGSGWPVLISVRRGTDAAGTYRWLQKMSAKVDGLLIAEGLDFPEQLARLASRVPVVLVSGSADAAHGDVVAADNHGGITAMVSHLVEQHGRTRLFYVGGPREAPDARERRAAFTDALSRYPGVRLAGSFEGQFATFSGQRAAREILEGPRAKVPDAVVCANDQMAIGVMRELLYLGALLSPPLTTVHQPLQRLGERACELLLERIADPSLPRRIERLPATVIPRESCGCHSSPRPWPVR